MEIGGYIELERFRGTMLHNDFLKLNCGRAALAYLIITKHIKRIWLPYFLCETISETCKNYGVDICYYKIDKELHPISIKANDGDFVYLVNYYGQLSADSIRFINKKYKNLIVDNTQAYFEEPIDGLDTIYTCRKYFGVSDGGLLYTKEINHILELEVDESYDRIRYVLGRYERNAGEFYKYACDNNEYLGHEPIKRMSKLTENLLHAVDYQFVKDRRTANFAFLHEKLGVLNKLVVKPVEGAFMYPFMVENAQIIKKKLLEYKIYIPTLWPNVVNELPHDWWEWRLANNVLPLPCDQRYGLEEMKFMTELLLKYIRGERA